MHDTEQPRARWALTGLSQTDWTWPEATGIPAMRRAVALDFQSQASDRTDPSPWQSELSARLERLALLPPGWDGDSARAISSRVVEAVRMFITSQLVEQTLVKPQLVPTCEGGLQLEWHSQTVDLVIECEPAGPVTYYFFDVETGAESEGSILDQDAPLGTAFIRLGCPAARA